MNNNEEVEKANEETYIECPKCERRIKEEEKECPYCQYDLINRPKIEKEEMETYKKWFAGGLLAIIVIVIVGISISSDNTNTTASANTANKTNNILNKVNNVTNITENKTVNQSSTVNSNSSTSSNIKTDTQNTITLKYGKLQSFTTSPSTTKCCVIKAKIEPSYNNKATIHHNFFNVENFIKNQNGNTYDEIQYWAVADMTNGEEEKVISFTVDKKIIDDLYNDKIATNMLDSYLNDFWVIESLKEE